MIVCSACATANEAGRRFCKECGATLTLACPSCGAPNSPDSKFCGQCGAALMGGAAAAPVREAAPSERRLVSVLFADLVGFTTISERRDAEDVRDLLSRYFDAARAAIERHGGLVEKFIGDAVMAVWGTPVAHEDDAERAVRAGLELVDAVAGLGHDIGVDLAARAGVLTGEAATTVGGLAEGIVVGDMVNTASRLQSAAEPGTVLVGEGTYRSASKAVAFVEVGELSLKGKDELVRAWTALRVIGERGGAGRVAGTEPPFVGRAEELRLVKDSLHAAEREGKARLVSVMGVGGIGKSRLAWEFRKYVDGLADDIYWHQGRCPAYGEGVTFWALGEMVRMRAGIAETDDPPASLAKLAEAMRTYLPDDEERRWAEPRLAHLLGLGDRPSGEREELFSAWRTFFERIADRGPTVMVFEDLQWADAGLIDFIESTLEWSRDRPILIVSLARPELSDRRPSWGTAQRSFTSIRLEPLPEPSMTALVQGFVPGLDPQDVARIVGRAEGVPLYAVETVRMLADRGVLALDDEGYAVVGDVGTLEVPETLHALIAARLDALPAEDRSLLQDASVLGKSFTPVALAAIADVDATTLPERLRDLVRKEFLVHEVDPRSPERGQYTFQQSLIREVAYATLAKAERRRRHLAAAHHLETVADDELAGVVATHYVEAFRVSPEGPDAQALAARARDWLGQASDRALSLGSPEQALAYARQGIEITPEGSERAVALARAGEALFRLGRQEEAVTVFDEAIGIRQTLNEPAEVARLFRREGAALIFTQRRQEVVERAQATLRELGPDDEWAAAGLHEASALAYFFHGESEAALTEVELGLPIAERHAQEEEFRSMLLRKANILFSLGRHREGVILAQGLVAIARQGDDLTALCEALMNLGVLSAEEHPRLALDAFLGAADAARRSGSRFDEIMGMSNAAESATDVGDFDRADQLLDDLRDREIPEANQPALAMDRAVLAAYRGAEEMAQAELDAIADRMDRSEVMPLRTWYLRACASTRLLAGDAEGAFALSRAALEPDPTGMNAPNAVWAGVHAALWAKDADRTRQMIASAAALRGPWITAVCRTAEAGLAAIEGRVPDAVDGFAGAYDAWNDLGLPLDHAWSVVDAVAVLPPDSVPDDALTQARDTLNELRATPLLERLDAARSPAPGAVGAPSS